MADRDQSDRLLAAAATNGSECGSGLRAQPMTTLSTTRSAASMSRRRHDSLLDVAAISAIDVSQ